MNRINAPAIAMLMLIALPCRALAQPGDAARGERLYRACVACHSLAPGRHGAPPDRFAWRHARVDTPSARLLAKRPELFTASMIGVQSPFGFVNAANTAPLPWGDRLFHTWDARRPVEIDPQANCVESLP